MDIATNRGEKRLPSYETPASDVRDRCMAILREGLRSNELALFCHAAEALTETGHRDEVLGALRAKLARAPDDRSRCLCARELVRAGDSTYLSVVSDLIEHDTEPVQIAAVECLYKIKCIGDEGAIRRMLSSTDNAMLKLMTFGALAANGDQKSLDQIRHRLDSEAANVRKIAAWLLTRLGDLSDIARLSRAKEVEGDPVVCAYVDHALAALGHHDGIDALKANMFSDNAEIRQMAADSARLLLRTVAQAELQALLADSDADVRIRAAHAIVYRETHDCQPRHST